MTARSRQGGRRGLRGRLRSLGAAVVALALLIAPPLVLVQGVGSPIADFPRSLSEVQLWWEQRYLPVGVVMGVLTLVLWLLWAQYVWALLWEVFVAGPRAARGHIGRQAPGVPRFTRSLVTSLVSGVMSAGLVASTAGPALAPLVSAIVPSPGPVASLMAEAVGVAPDAPVAAPAAPVTGQPRLYQVQADDSLWRLAGQDEAVLKRILELNEDQIRTPVDLRPGMVLRLPAGADAPQGAPSPPGPAVQPTAGPREQVVERGDNLWQLTEAQLVAAGTPDPSNAQIVDQLGRVIELNTPPIVDPDLIYPGQVVLLPPVGASATDAPLAPLAPPAGPADTDPAPASGADAGGVPPGADLGAVSTGAVLGQIDPAPVAAAPPAVASGDVTAADPAALRGVEVLGVAAAAMLALVERTRRRHRAAFGFAPAGAGPAGGTFLDELAAAADPGLTLWAAAELYPLLQVAAGIATVALSNVDGLEVTWTAEPEVEIDGWTVVEPRRWRRPYDGPVVEEADLPPVALPGLVTLGEQRPDPVRPGGPQVLANLGTLGSLSVAGPPEQVAATVRAMVYELGLGEHLSNAFVTTVGFTIGDAEQLDRVARRSEEEALQLAREAVERQERADHRLGPRELEVLVVRTEHTNLNAFLDLAGRRAGMALIVAGDVRSSRIGARFVLADDGSGRFPGLDVPLVASALTRPQEQELTRLLATAALPPAGPADAAPATPAEIRERVRARGASRWPRPTTGGTATPGMATSDTATPDTGQPDSGVLVHLLGAVRCPSYPELRAHTLALVAFLAVQPDRRAGPAQLAAALWGDQAVSPAQVNQVIDAARAILGPDHLPAAGDGLDLRLVGIRTDLEVLHDLFDGDQPSPEALADALELVEGPPFGGAPLRWVGGTDLADHAAELVEAVVLDTVEAAQRAGDTVLANLAVHRGLGALPTSERLYRAWMRLAAAERDPALIESIYRSLQSAVAADEGGGGLQPTGETRALYEALLRSASRQHAPVGS